MAQPIPPDQYDTIVTLIRCFPDGVGAGDLRRHLHPIPDTPEMVHCLRELARKRRIEVIAGTMGAPNARYRALPDPPGARPAPGSLPGDVDTERNLVPPVTPPPVQPAAGHPANPVSPPIPPPASAAATAGPAAGAAPAFEDVVREVVRDVVLSLSPKPSAVALAQTQAAILHWNAALTATLLERVEQELRRVTPEMASEFGVVPEQVRAWRAVYDGSGVAPEPGPAPAPMPVPGKPEPKPRPPAGPAPTPPPPAARAPARPTSGPAAGRAVARHETVDGSDASAPVGPSWAPSSGSKRDIPASLANALGTGLAGALSRAFGDKFTAKERLVLGGVIAAILMSVYQPLLSSRWTAIGLPVIGLVAYLGYVFRRRTALTAGVAGPVPAGWLRSGFSRYRWLLAAGCVLVLAAVAGWIGYQRVVLRPPKAVISDYLARSVAPLPVRLVGLEPAYGRPSSVGCPVTYQALFESTEPLYQRIDAGAYLREHAAGELAAIEAANALLRGPDGAALRAALGAVSAQGVPGNADATSSGRDALVAASTGAPGASHPRDSARPPAASSAAAPSSFPPVLVSTRTAPGAVAPAGGSLVAWREHGAWRFSGSPVALDRTALVGEPKPAGAFAIDDPVDVARLQALVAAQAAYAARVQAAATALAAAREHARQQQEALAALLAPGTLFIGTISDPGGGTPQPVWFEITSSAAPSLAAVLHDRGWTKVRRFTGGWAFATDGGGATVTLRTTRAAAVAGAGPLLEERLDWAVSFILRADGTIAAVKNGDPKIEDPLAARSAVVSLWRIAPADAAAVKEALVPESAPPTVAPPPPAPRTIPAYNPAPPPNVPPAGAEVGEPRLPPYPTSPGAYLLSVGQSLTLPRNAAEVIKVLPGVNGGVGQLVFYGEERVPLAAAGEVTLIYVGRLWRLSDATLKQYPHLKADPPFEVAPLVVESGIVRDAVVAELAPDFTGFGALKVPVKVDQPAADIIRLRATLRPGRYALACGVEHYELAVQ